MKFNSLINNKEISMKAVLVTFLLAVLLVTFNNQSYSQYRVGRNTAGVMVGFGGGGYVGTGAVPIAVEFNFLNFERNIQAGLFASYSSTTEDFGYNDQWKYTYIVIAAQGNWHFMPGEKLDPFAGLSLGFDIGSVKYNGPNAGYYANPSVGGVFFSAQAGLNYWFSNNIAVQLRVGYSPYAAIGITFGL